MKRPLNVAILMETSRSFGRGVIRGVAKYAHLHGPWVFHLMPGDLNPKLPPMGEWDGDGVIGRVDTLRTQAVMERRGLKVVCLGGAGFADRRYVGTATESLCRQAVDHLADRGLDRLAYFGGSASWSAKRAEVFARLAAERGRQVSVFRPKRPGDGGKLSRELLTWLKGLQKPVGILAADDLAGRQVIDACALADIPVPERVAVIGIDNDELICEVAHPSLSSVALNGERIGYESARVLSDLMLGKAPQAWVEVEPLGVVARQSTDIVAVTDADLSAALRYIRQHACEGATVADVVNEVSISRKTLEERFKRVLGRTPQVEIRRVQMDRARDLILRSDLKLAAIAKLAGFSSVQYLHATFKEQFGSTPFEYRIRNRATAG